MPCSACAEARPGLRPGARRAASRIRRLGRRGATSVEFALVGPLLILLLVGGIEAGRYMLTLESLRMASAEAVRATALRGGRNIGAGLAGCTGLSGAQSGDAALLPFLDATKLEVTLSGCTTEGAVTRVTVALRYPHAATLPVFAVTLTETAQAIFN